MSGPHALPLGRPSVPGAPSLDQPPVERADAARNRAALLCAARELMGSEGACGLSMERVARHAGVGVGTVYRRFTDRAGLAMALLDDAERRFQAAYLSGPAPLGPGAEAPDRIRAFLHGYLDRLETDAELHTVAELASATGHHNSGAYRTSHTHLSWLLTEAGAADPAYQADALLALLGAGLFTHLRRERHLPLERIKAGADAVLAGMVVG